MRTALLLGLVVLSLSGCLGDGDRLVIGVTTSTHDSGLLDVLVPAAGEALGVKVVAVVGGTGEVIEKARLGDVDVLLTHSPARERPLVDEGHAVSSEPVMYNRFLVVGPRGDPAGVGAAVNASEAFARVVESGVLFVSRGDGSGTHDREVEIWDRAMVDPGSLSRERYKETGAGQAQTLLVAAEKKAYALTDEATWARLRAGGELRAMASWSPPDPLLRNVYSITLLDAERHPHLEHDAAADLAAWLASPEARALVAGFRVGGQQVFYPVDQEGAV